MNGKKAKKWQYPVLDQAGDSEDLVQRAVFFGWRIEQPTTNSPIFSEKAILKGLPLTSTAASGYFGKIVWC